MAAIVDDSRPEVTIDGNSISVASVGTVGPSGADGSDGSDGSDGADGADGVGPISTTGIQNALVASEQETLVTIGAGVVSGYTDDLRESMFGKNVDNSSGRLDFDWTENALAFTSNARYAVSDQVSMNFQLPHGWVEGSSVDIHTHWLQSSATFPQFVFQYRVLYHSLGTVGAWSSLAKWTSGMNLFSYSSGTIPQITDFVDVDMTGAKISDLIQLKLWRDTGNASGLFAGNDSLNASVLAVYTDAHILKDSIGSIDEYDKDGI